VSGLVLIGPSNLVPAEVTLPDTWRSETLGLSDSLGSNSPTFTVPQFTYEHRFPILHLEASDSAGPGKAEELTNSHLSTWPIENVDFKVVVSSKAALYDERHVVKELKYWLDEVGM
jgi:hypothetical protein